MPKNRRLSKLKSTPKVDTNYSIIWEGLKPESDRQCEIDSAGQIARARRDSQCDRDSAGQIERGS